MQQGLHSAVKEPHRRRMRGTVIPNAVWQLWEKTRTPTVNQALSCAPTSGGTWAGRRKAKLEQFHDKERNRAANILDLLSVAKTKPDSIVFLWIKPYTRVTRRGCRSQKSTTLWRQNRNPFSVHTTATTAISLSSAVVCGTISKVSQPPKPYLDLVYQSTAKLQVSFSIEYEWEGNGCGEMWKWNRMSLKRYLRCCNKQSNLLNLFDNCQPQRLG